MKFDRGMTAGQLREILAILPDETPIRVADNQGGEGWLRGASVVFDTQGETEIIPGYGSITLPPYLRIV